MRNLSNEMKVAGTIILAIVIAFLGYRLMSDLPILRKANIIHTYFEKVDGLAQGNYVYVSGVKVGSVNRIRLLGRDSVQVSMNFDRDMEVPRGSVAYLESSGLLDEKAIVIERSDSREMIPRDGVMEGVYRGGMMETLKNEGEKLSGDVSESFEKLNILLEQLNTMLATENQNRIQQSLSYVEETMEDISLMVDSKRGSLEEGIDHANRFLANLDSMSTRAREDGDVDSLVTGMNRTVAELEALSSDLNETSRQLNEILGKINSGEGSMGRMINDPSLYDNMDSLAVEMNRLIRNINSDPGRYLKHMRLIEIF